MRNARFAEWIIAALTDRSRAAAIVGDLLETAEEAKSWQFWFSVTGVALSLVGRPVFAFVTAWWITKAIRVGILIPALGLHAVHRIPDAWRPLQDFGALLMIATIYLAICYGLRDELAQLALGFTTLITIATFYWWVPRTVVACMALGIAVICASLWSSRRRRGLASLAVAFVVGFGGLRLFMYLDFISLDVIYSYPLFYYVAFGFVLAATLITALACAVMHRLLLSTDRRKTEVQ